MDVIVDERYLQALVDEQDEAVTQAWPRHRELFTDGPDEYAFSRMRDELLPDPVKRRLKSAKSVGFTDLEVSPQLVPYYDLQLVRVCSECSCDPETAEQQAAWLEPMVECGLVIPVVPSNLSQIQPRLQAAILKAPWVLHRVVDHLGAMRHWTSTGSRPCASCQNPECALFNQFDDLMERVGLDGMIAHDALSAVGTGPDELVQERLDVLARLDEHDLIDFALSASVLGDSIDDVYQADVFGARSCMTRTRLDAVVEGVAGQARVAPDARLLSAGATDVAVRLATSAHVGIDYDPRFEPAAYIEAVAAHAGHLAGVFIDDGEPDAATLTSMGDTAAEINDSVSRMAKTEARLKTAATALSNPVARAALVGAAAIQLSPWLAACGVGGVMLQEALKGAKDSKEPVVGPALSAAALKALEGIGVFAPGTYAVHDLRKRLGR